MSVKPKEIKRLCAWRKRVNRGVYHDKEVSDAAKAAFRRAAYQTERKDENDDERGIHGMDDEP